MGDPVQAEYVMVGFSMNLLARLDDLLPAESLAIIEEPDVAEARKVAGRCRSHACFAGLVEALIHDEADVRRVADSLPRFPKAKVIFPGVEYGVVATAALAERLGRPGAGLGAAQVLRNKALLREAAGRHGLNQPRWFEVATADEAEAARAKLGGRCVLKPANRQGSVGVQLLSAGDDMGLAWEHAVSADEPRLRARRKLPASFLVEERMDGSEVSVECLLADGTVVFRNVTDKALFPGPYPIERGHLVPAPLAAGTIRKLYECMDRLIVATGFKTGIMHSEWILREDGEPGLVECAGRMPGDGLDALIDHAYGGSLLGGLITVLGGEEKPQFREPGRAAAVRFLESPPGIMCEVQGAEIARAMPGIIEVGVSIPPGMKLPKAITSATRAAYAVAIADNPATAASQADAAISAMRVVVDT